MALSRKAETDLFDATTDQHPVELPRVYPGTPSPWSPASDVARFGAVRNRKVVRRRVSPFTVVLLLLGTAIIIVLYISNIIAVDQLLADINGLEKEEQHILMEQEILRAQVNKLASLERIQELAEKDLGLRTPQEPPIWLNLSQERLREIEQLPQKP